ncbi:uncharacterized protein IUM83_11778 [Phytophthora cinnamomi]|uniref:uncharacterized protein n=1 Tax=Phytophthora cinnamomi TaxID=4785 RepID=UPI00355AC964|nr:hypothetical protein IUM83_11778 [Phytophthora cinnamomi]
MEERNKRWEASLIEMAAEKEKQDDEKCQRIRDSTMEGLSDDDGDAKQPSQDQGPSEAEVKENVQLKTHFAQLGEQWESIYKDQQATADATAERYRYDIKRLMAEH